MADEGTGVRQGHAPVQSKSNFRASRIESVRQAVRFYSLPTVLQLACQAPPWPADCLQAHRE
jgi:hypothetical protein